MLKKIFEKIKNKKPENLTEKFKKNLILNWIILFWIILFLIWSYIFYKIFLTWKIYNNISKNIDYFVEFDLRNYDKFWEFLWKNQPFYTSYLDEMNFSKWSVIFYKWEKIDWILTWSKRKSLKFLEKISTKKEIKKNWNLLISNYSPAPNCIQNWNNLFCSKNTEILEEFISDIEKWDILKKNSDFLKIENNLNVFWNFIFWYAKLNNENNFPLISEKFISWWFSFWKRNLFFENSEIEWIFYWNYEKNSWEIFYEEKKFLNNEKFLNEENTIIFAYSRDFTEKLEKYFEFYSKENPEIMEIWKNIFEQKKSEFKLFLEQNFWWKIILENPEEDVFVLSENSDFLWKNEFKIFDKNNYSDEKLFINLEKIRENFWFNYLKNFNILSAYSKNFDDWIQVKIEIK